MKLLILSHFDAIAGPKVFLKEPNSINKDIIELIPDLMDIYDKPGFFVHIFDKYKSANLVFDIKNRSARGGVEILLISVVVDDKSDINIDLSKELLNGFAEEVRKIDDAYLALYIGSRKIKGDPNKLKQLKSLFSTFYSSFPEVKTIETRKDVKIFVFGMQKAGKSSIINTLQRKHLENTIPTTSVALSKIQFHNLSILIQDAPGQEKFRNLWSNYLNQNQNALVFVLDITDDNYTEARKILHEVANLPKMKNLPILILYNKVDLKDVKLSTMVKEMDIKKIGGKRNAKCFLTSATKNKGILESFSWLAQELSNS